MTVPARLRRFARPAALLRGLGVLLLAGTLLMRPTLSANVTVSTTADTVDGNTSNIAALVSNPGSDGRISLREAITAANNTAGEDSITLPTGTYTLSGGTFSVTEALVINGGGESGTVIDANNSSRVFSVGNVNLTLQAMTLTKGSDNTSTGGGLLNKGTGNLSTTDVVFSSGASPNQAGGAVFSTGGSDSFTGGRFANNSAGGNGGALSKSNGALSISGVAFSSNSTANNQGGAVFFSGSTLTVSGSSFSSNNSNGTSGGALTASISGSASVATSHFTSNTANNANGGAVYAAGTGTWAFTDSEFDGNRAGTAGGGLYVGNNAAATLLRVTFVDNVASNGQGGALRVAHGNASTTTATNVTLHSNDAPSSGGGGAAVSAGTLALVNATVVNNTATNGAAGLTHAGGTLTLKNTLVAANTGGSGNCSSGITSQGYNLDSGNTCAFTATGDRVNATAGLGTFANHGGLTRTVALASNSAAINNGTGSGAPTSDQRGYARSGNTDIGAFEFGGTNTLAISGTVFEDRNYGGGAGRSLSASSGTGLNGARVELYTAAGLYLQATTTAANGTYSFTGVTANTGYVVRLPTVALASGRSGGTTSLPGVLTFRTNASSGSAVAVTDHVGGINPAVVDAGNGSGGAAFSTASGVFSAGSGVTGGTAQAFSTVAVGSGSVSGIDFGVNHNTVVNTNNSGQGSLRQAMSNVDTLGGDSALAQSGLTAAIDNVVFMLGNGSSAAGLRASVNFFSGGVATITPQSALPWLNNPAVMDARKQPGWVNKPVIELVGSSAGANIDGLMLRGGSTVAGFNLHSFGRAGIYMAGGGNVASGCWVGMLPNGSTAAANTEYGIWVYSGSGDTIGGTDAADGNLVSGNGNSGIAVESGGSNTVIQGNTIGLNAAGTAALGNGADGISLIGPTGVTIGGTSVAARNVISGNNIAFFADGIWVAGGSGHTITGNHIGTDATGTVALGNTVNGIRLDVSTTNNTVGGTAAGAANLIAFNTVGIDVIGGRNNRLRGNRITLNTNNGITLDGSLPNNDGAKNNNRGNQAMDHPVVTSGSLSGSTLTLSGYVGSAAGQSAFANSTVDVYLSDASSTKGQGKTWLGSFTTDGANGNFSGKTVTCTCPAEAYITLTATDTSGNTSTFSANVLLDRGNMISGTVFEDLNYGGGAGRKRLTALRAGGAVRSGARVELYTVSGSTATVAAVTTTDSNGSYAFTGLGNATYYVRVMSSSVTSSRTGATASLVPVLTFLRSGGSDVTNQVGGATPGNTSYYNQAGNVGNQAPAALGTGTAEGVATVTKGNANPITGVDFGYSFNVVSNNNDTGQGSLRQAITNANTLGGDALLSQANRTAAIEHVVFMLSYGANTAGLRSSNNHFSGGVATLTPASALPTITQPLVVDARTQPNWSANPIVQLAGQSAGAGSSGLYVTAGGSTLAGFIVNRFALFGLRVEVGGGNTIAGNWVGLATGGTAASANGGEGVVVVSSAGNTIGGLATRDRNVLSGNGSDGGTVGGNNGLVIAGSNCSANQVLGNYIGTNAAGTAAVKNHSLGMYVECPNTVIGGSASGARNVVSGNQWENIQLANGSEGTVVQGNYIGTTAAGTAALANGSEGLYIWARNITVGGTAAGEGNVISGNGASGVLISGSGATGVTVQGNTIGRNAANSADIANGGHGVLIQASASNNSVGGTAAGAGNVIRGNALNGVTVLDSGATGNAILGNSMAGNAGLGIDLALSSGTVAAANGAKSASEPNLGMDAATFTSALYDSATSVLTVTGYVGSAAGKTAFASARVEVFIADTTAAGNGEGQTYVGSLTADASGNFSGTFTVAGGITTNSTRVTATATDSANNSSEFGPNQVVESPRYAITGTVFEDKNYGGGAGRSRTASSGVGVAGVRVEVYDSTGRYADATTTDSSGNYSLPPQQAGTWHVRVVGGTVASNRNTSAVGALAVMTFRTHASAGTATAVTDHVGGINPALGSDAASASTGAVFDTSTGVFSAGVSGTAQHFSAVQIGTAVEAGIDFGFNFSTVVNTNDSGAGSLRQAITNANALDSDNTLAQVGRTAGVEHVVFMISNGSAAPGLRSSNNLFSAGVATITPTSVLPTVSSTLVLDAALQPGWTNKPLIELNGSNAGANANGLNVGAAGVVIRGWVINRFTGSGISATSTGLVLQGSYIGVNSAGTTASANAVNGVLLTATSGSTIGGTAANTGNLISGNQKIGVQATGTTTGLVIQGNLIGTNAAGTAALGNGWEGVSLAFGVSGSQIGGATTDARNVISGNGSGGAKGGIYIGQGSGNANNVIQGNYIGVNAAGTAVMGNAASGIWLADSSVSGTLVGGSTAAAGNVISGNTGDGIKLASLATTVRNNLIGTNAAGSAALTNTGAGIRISGSANAQTIGGAGAGNLISGNTAEGIYIDTASASGTVIQGNTIGLDSAGTAAVPNRGNAAVSLAGSATGLLIGGSAAGQGNVISGNASRGIWVVSGSHTFLGNYIGTNAAGTATVLNNEAGMVFDPGAGPQTIGGTAAGAGNVISGNARSGIWLNSSAASGASSLTGTTIQGNRIGTNAAGTALLPNGWEGIAMRLGVARAITIGGAAAGAGNVIAGNTLAGVRIEAASDGNAIQGNRIYGNGGLGIDLGSTGVTANDGALTTGQPNQLMDFPVLTAANLSGTTLNVAGYVGSAPNQSTFASARVEVFASDGSSTNGQGQTYLGFLTADTNGNFSGTLAGVTGLTTGTSQITATATNGNGNTSEFSANYLLGGVVSGTVFEDANYGGGAGRSLADSGGGGGTAGATVELYNSSGTWVRSTTTASGGGYSFTGLSAGNYFVRVVNNTVRSLRTGTTASLVGVLSFRTDASGGSAAAVTDGVGGTNPALVDPGAASGSATFNTSSFDYSAGLTGTAQNVAPVALSAGSGNIAGVDFGFHFGTVVNTNDSGQGSLRQAITNANTLASDHLLAQAGRTAAIEHLVFMLPNGTAAAGLRSGFNAFTTSAGSYNVATIAVGSALPTVTSPLVLDAQTQPGWTGPPLIELNGSGAGSSSGLWVNASASVVRGWVINRFNLEGIVSTAGANLVIQGNYIGLNAAGTAASGNGYSGIWMNSSASGHLIGGTTTSARNVIGGHRTFQGIALAGGSSHNILGNHVGTDVTGTVAIGNASDGIKLYGGVSNSNIGGTTSGAGNLVRSNGGVGILVNSGATGIQIRANSIHGNTGIGIDLNADGLTANDGTKGTGANLGMDFPVLSKATVTGTTLTVSGYVGSAASQATFGGALVDIYLSDATNANGQGKTYLGTLTADANGNFSGTLTGISGVTNGSSQLTGTATDSAGNTSEFGPNHRVGMAISGTVFEDKNYGGGAGRSFGASGGSGVNAATVELYDSAGVFVSTTTTAANGSYSFRGLAAAVYNVRVLDSSVRSTRSGSTSTLRAVLSYRSDAPSGTAVGVTDHVGGFNPAVADGNAGTNGTGLWTKCASEGGSCSFTGTQVVRYGAAARFAHRVFTANTACHNGIFGDPIVGVVKACYVFNQAVQSLATVNLGTADTSAIDFGYSFHTVVNTADAGQGSLRQAITNANTLGDDTTLAQAGRTAGIDHLVFMLPNATASAGLRSHVPTAFTTNGGTANVATIALASGLPTLSTAMVVDAQTQPGFSTRPLLELNGAAAGNTTGFRLTAAGGVLRGFIVNRFAYSGIELTATATVQGNWSGVDATGNAAAANASHGLNVTGGSAVLGGAGSTQGNVLSGNGGAGVWLNGGSGHVLQGNLVGLGADGSTRLGNTGFYGVEVYAAGNTIGGSAAGAGNTISGQTGGGKGGVWLCSSNNTLQGNRIGTNLAGTAAVPNNSVGINVCNNVSGNTLGGTAGGAGNLVSGNNGHGIADGGNGTVIQGNTIGLDATGLLALGNSGSGVYLSGSTGVVGGSTAGARNVIGANAGAGVNINAGSGHTVSGNHIGVGSDGSTRLGNTVFYGVEANGGGGYSITGNTISGQTASGKGGVYVCSNNNTLQGNRIGTNAAGTAAVPNAGHGVTVCNGSTGTLVGGLNAGEGNLLSGNGGHGVSDSGSGTVLRGNTIGLNASRAATLANGSHGVLLSGSGATVGGTAAGAGNTIAGNTGSGVQVAAGEGHAVLGNRMGGNGGLGIDLGSTTGVTANDGGTTAGQPNLLTDAPVITSGRARGNLLTVAGHVGSAAGQAAFANHRVAFFTADNDASGHGEGVVYLGTLTTDANGNFSGSFTLPMAALALGTRLTATATSAANNTSEFSAQFSSLLVDMVVNSTLDEVDANPGDGLCSTASGVCTLRAAIEELNAWASLPQTPVVAFDLPGCSSAGQAACSIAPATALPTVARAMVVDATSQPGWNSGTAAPLVELNGATAPASAIGLVVNTSGFTLRGLVVNHWGSHGLSLGGSGHTVAGNWFGVNAAGTAKAANGGHGIAVTGTGNLIGGRTAADRNVLSGNALAGISLTGSGNTVKGNFVGLLPDGQTAAGNTQDGVYTSAANQVMGGSAAGEGNVVSANGRNGVRLDTGADNAVLQGNLIGVAADGSTARGNGGTASGSGVGLLGTINGSRIGGTGAGEGNLIAHSNNSGVGFGTNTAQQVAVLGNRIFNNGTLGIRLNIAQANDGAYNNAQSNHGMDHPVITGAGINAGGSVMTVYGHIGTGTGQAAFAGARVEFFKAAADPTGYGEGQVYLGSLTADANGRFSGTVAYAAGAAVVGDVITATATDTSGNTSEFGPNWTSTTVESLAPGSFNAFETGTANGATSGVIQSKTADTPTTLAVVALDSSSAGLHPGFTGTVALNWLDARDNSGAASGSCRASWASLGSAGSVDFSNNARQNVALTPPASGTRAMRLQMVYAGPAGTVTACSSDEFAVLPASLALAATDADAATAGSTRLLDNGSANGGVVHRAGRPFTVTVRALSASGTLMANYDGSPVLATTGCVLPSGCTPGTLGGSLGSATGGVASGSLSYAEVGAIQLKASDANHGNVDSADTTAAARTVASADTTVGRFVPDSYTLSVGTAGVLATANAACMASGGGATFFDQGFGWATAPQVNLVARNAAGGTTTFWTGALMKLSGANPGTPGLAASNTGSATLATSFGAITLADLGGGQVRLTANSSDRFLLALATGSLQASLTPTWHWTLAVADTSEAAVAGNPASTAATATQLGVGFDQGAVFHQGRLSLASSHGDARRGVRALVQLQRYTANGWVTLTEDRGCVTVAPANLGVAAPTGVFTTAGLCAAPLPASTTTRGGRAWLVLPATPGGRTGRLQLSLAGEAATGNACSSAGAVQAVVPLGLPYLTGGTATTGPAALATWGAAQRDTVLRRETW